MQNRPIDNTSPLTLAGPARPSKTLPASLRHVSRLLPTLQPGRPPEEAASVLKQAALEGQDPMQLYQAAAKALPWGPPPPEFLARLGALLAGPKPRKGRRRRARR